jgi:Crp-like helix-turn-helix protein
MLSDVVDGFPKLSLDAGATVLPNELAAVAYLFVDEGLVVLRTALPDSTRRTITCHAGAGALILPPGPDEVLVALTAARVVALTTELCEELIASPEAANLLLEGLAESLRQEHAALAGMARLHHVDRVRQKLIQLARDHGRVGREGIRLDFPLTHDLLGEMTGSARETVTRALDELQREGFVVRDGRTYSVQVAPEELGLTPV